MQQVQLRLFGEVGWSLGGRFTPIHGSTRIAVILLLADARGAAVSVDSLLARLWAEPPRSGANAVQRHVSALRSQLRELGVDDPHQVISSASGGYRLVSATDLVLLEGLVRSDEPDFDRLRWWDEPLVGAPWETAQSVRSQLQRLASQALTRWAASLPFDRATDARERADHMLAHTPDCYAAIHVRQESRDRVRREQVEVLEPAGVDQLRKVAGLWAHGRGPEALDALEMSAQCVPTDLSRRLCRAFIWLDPDELWARHVVSVLIEDAVSSPEQHERSVITLDARVLEEHHDGESIARDEVELAETKQHLVRALRVAYMLSLSAPHEEAHDCLVDRLAVIDHPDARVESRRFQFISDLRLHRLDVAVDSLQHYQTAVQHHWPGTGDDFAPMARAALQRSADPSVRVAFGYALPQIGAFTADRWVLPLAETTRRLLDNDEPEPRTEIEYHATFDTMSHPARHGMSLLRDLNAGRPVIERAHELVDTLLPVARDKQFMMLPVALCVVAEASNDRVLAKAVAAAIEPWAGQTLGLWPVDFLFGPADDWLARLDAI